MGTHRYGATSWELEAARRREVVCADFEAATKARRRSMGIVAGRSGVMTGHPQSWLATLARVVGRDHADPDEVPCGTGMTAIRPGC